MSNTRKDVSDAAVGVSNTRVGVSNTRRGVSNTRVDVSNTRIIIGERPETHNLARYAPSPGQWRRQGGPRCLRAAPAPAPPAPAARGVCATRRHAWTCASGLAVSLNKELNFNKELI